MSTVYGWTGPGDDARWEEAEEADYRADRRRKAEERASAGNLPRGWSRLIPLPPGTCPACRGHGVVANIGGYQRPDMAPWALRPCPECAA